MAGEVARQMAAAPKQETPKAKGLGGLLGQMFAAITFVTVKGAQTYDQKNTKGEKTGVSTQIGTYGLIMFGPDGKANPSAVIGANISRVEDLDGNVEIRASLPGASITSAGGVFKALSKDELAALRTEIRAKFIEWRTEQVKSGDATTATGKLVTKKGLTDEERAALGV